MVAPIDPSQALARLAALMRSGAKATPRPGARADTVVAAEATLQQRLRAIAPDHPRRQRALSRVLIEDLLSREFGADLVVDAGFQGVVDDVLDALERSPALHADLAKVTAALAGPTP